MDLQRGWQQPKSGWSGYALTMSLRALCVRPSGTEPKVKVYILAKGTDPADRDQRVARYAAWAETLKN